MRVRVGTRGSELALTQTNLVRSALQRQHPEIEFEIVEIKTLGCRKQGTAAASHSDKKDWVIDLEQALLSSSIDLAVHSSKDVPAELEPGTSLRSVLARGNPFDAFIGRPLEHGRLAFSDLPEGATVGTASLRRRGELLRFRPDLKIVEHRGNVPTRIRKLDESDAVMGIILACSGLERLNIPNLEFSTVPVDVMMPAVNQGTLCAQYRTEDDRVESLLKSIQDPQTEAVWIAERAVAEALEGDCKSAIAIYGEHKEKQIHLGVRVMTRDGSELIEDHCIGEVEDAHELGLSLGKRVLQAGGREILEKSRTE